MASAAKPSNHIDPKVLTSFLDRHMAMEDEVVTIMMTATKECKDGPRQDQKDLKLEIKEAGIPSKVWGAALAVRKALRKPEEAIADLEDDDRDQLLIVAEKIGGAFGDYIRTTATT